ncbi:MAG: glycosyltransferase family 39 protein, partial [Deltaproteobacteria bacterium]|nr:glycosyltransferase family 39 protein [Deltaproteobacteria bacterium]
MIKLIIVVLNTCAALSAAFLLPPKSIYYVFQDTGYFFIFVSFFLWVICLFRLYFAHIKSIFFQHYGGLLLSTVLMVLIFCIAPPKFKILPDESNLIGVSMAMYQSKKAYLPTEGFNVGYQEPAYRITIDKRPLLYPLMVSLVHSLRGYSPYNGFVVNFILGILILFLFYLFIYDHFPRIYSFLAVLILAALPSFVMWVTSSGFETLNLFFIVLTIFLFKKVIDSRSIQHAELLFLTLVLVSQCRYESMVFTVAILFLLPILLRKKAIAELSLITFITPFLFIPTIWLPRLYAQLPVITKMSNEFVQAANLYDAFSYSNLISNTSNNLIVFLGLDPNLGFSAVISGLSMAGIYLMTKR